MADMEPVYDALRKASTEGNAEQVAKLSAYINSQSKPPQEEPLQGLEQGAASAAKFVAGLPDDGKDAAQNWFSMGQGNEAMGLGEAGGKIAGSAVGGAVAEAGLPALMAKVPPVGPVGRTVKSLGELGMMMPLGARVAGGLGGGTGMGIVDTLSEKFGLPKALSVPTSLLAGGVGQSIGQMTSPVGGQLLTAVGQLARGNASGVVGAVKAAASPKKELDEATAVALQKKLFGDKTEGYVNSLESNDYRMALQAQLRKEDPSLLQTGAPTRAAAEGMATPIPGSGGPVSSSRDVMTAAGKFNPNDPTAGGAPLLTGPRALPGPGAGAGVGTSPKTEAGRSADEIKAALKAKASTKAEAEAAKLAQGAKPASEIYRDRYFGGVTDAVKRGEAFSTTPEAKAFEQKLLDQVALGNVSKGDAQKLLSSIRADRSSRGGVQEGYAESIDNRIREWGKPAEKGGQTGAAAVSSQTADSVRGELRKSFNAYTERLGLGKAEKQYRETYQKEKIAQAKDEIPLFLAGYGKSSEFEKLARNLAKDPESKQLLQVSMVRHLAQQEPKEVLKTFGKMEKVLQESGLLTLKEMDSLRKQAADVNRAVEGGVAGRGLENFARLVLRTVTTKLAGEAGQGMAKE